MFTVKLYSEGTNTRDVLVLSAAKVKVGYAPGLHGIEVVMFNEAGAMIDKVYLGERPEDLPAATLYSWGVVENSEGRTTEMLRPRPRLVPGKPQHSARA